MLLADPYAKPWKKLTDPEASIFLMPDTSAARLPQWDDALFGKSTTFDEDLASLEKLISAQKKNKHLKVLIAYSLKEVEAALPANHWKNNLGEDSYHEFKSLITDRYFKGDIEVIASSAGPRFSESEYALKADYRMLCIALHRCILKLARNEYKGQKERLKKNSAELAKLLNKHEIWALLINEYELRGVSPEAYVELLGDFRGAPIILHALVASTTNALAYVQLKKRTEDKVKSSELATMLRGMFMLQGAIPASAEQCRKVADKMVDLAIQYKDPAWSQFVCFNGQAEALAAAKNIPDHIINGEYSFSGYQLVRLALKAGNIQKAELIYKRMILDSRAYSYPSVRFAQALIAEAKGDQKTAQYARKMGLILATWHCVQGGYTRFPANMVMIEAGLLDECLRLDVMINWLNPRDRRLRVMLKGFAMDTRYAEAAFVAERIIHQDCLTSTPLRGRRSEARLVRFRAMADAFHGLALLKEGKAQEGDVLLSASLPLLKILDPTMKKWLKKKIEEFSGEASAG